MKNKSPDNRADQICHSMERLRKELDEDVHHVKRSASSLTDWQYYIRNYPWLSIGGAALIGYLIVPRKLEIQSPDAETLEKLARNNRLVVENQPRQQSSQSGLQSAASFLTGLVVKAAAAQLMHHLAGGFTSQEAGSVSPNSPSGPGSGEAGHAFNRNSENGE
ncbi:hypothetical protein Pan153_21840 [Gimesia panareensis]|uniref:DUF3618 domain-containing protein n=2 Tax=Gimesia panareensis TaxID=2527978 RepID=A0A518FMG1_9PLAN|nr:hypothetical protein Pan153_21840 [Gimesia panareensis]